MYHKMRNQNKAFTLIEIIIVIVLLAIVSITVGIMVTQQVQAVANSKDYATAFNLARLEMEVVNNLAYASITSLTTNNYENYPFTVERTVTYVAGGDATAESLKQILIQVRKSGSSANLTTIYTYIAKNTTIGL